MNYYVNYCVIPTGSVMWILWEGCQRPNTLMKKLPIHIVIMSSFSHVICFWQPEPILLTYCSNSLPSPFPPRDRQTLSLSISSNIWIFVTIHVLHSHKTGGWKTPLVACCVYFSRCDAAITGLNYSPCYLWLCIHYLQLAFSSVVPNFTPGKCVTCWLSDPARPYVVWCSLLYEATKIVSQFQVRP